MATETAEQSSQVLSKPPQDFHERSSIERVKLDDLKIDRTYQRDLSMGLVETIAANWDEVASELLLVSHRPNGDYYVVNGQHRMAAARMLGLPEVWARVVEGLKAKEEASLRLKTNVRLSDRPLERFKAQLAAGDSESRDIVKILAEFDTEVNEVPSSEAGINAISSVETIYRVDKGILLRETLAFIKDSYNRVDPTTAKAHMMKGVAWFVERHAREVDRDRAVEKAKNYGVAALDRRSRTIQSTMGGALWMNVYRSMVDFYNEQLREGSKLEWRMRGATRMSANAAWGRGA